MYDYNDLIPLHLLCTLLSSLHLAESVARFEIASVSPQSVVLRMIGAENVSRFEMDVKIFDLDRLKEFRRTELSAARHEDQLFSFDGLLPATWFAIRIEYRLIYVTPSGFTEYPTKQEPIVRTKTDTLYGDYATVEDRIITLEGIVSDAYHLNVTVSTVFALRPKLSTLIVPELRCDRGTVKPPAQRVTSRATVHFDVRKMFSKNAVRGPKCFQLCIFPFVRAEILENGQQTFRGREWCGSLEEAQQLFGSESHEASGSTPMPHGNASLLVTFLSVLICVSYRLL